MPQNPQNDSTDRFSESAAGSESAKPTKSGFVALIGSPNAGKSTLLNRLVGSKVSIVTHKVQTTRTVIRGIAMHSNAQIIFLDTPGIFQPKRRLERAMVNTAWMGARDADVVAVLLDSATDITGANQKLIKQTDTLDLPKVLILNKIDLLQREKLLKLAEQANSLAKFDRTFMISALKGDGVKDLLDYFAATMRPGPYYYPEDQIYDLPLKLLVAEITREKIFLRLHEELPYASTVETTDWKDNKDGSVRIEQTIFVERNSQKRIVIGKNAQTLKAVSTAARMEIAKMTDRKVHLFIFVKVRKNWAEDPERYREIGLEYPK